MRIMDMTRNMTTNDISPVAAPAKPADPAMALLGQIGLAAYRRDTKGMAWLTPARGFSGGTLSDADDFMDIVHPHDRAGLQTALRGALLPASLADGTYRLDYRLQLDNGTFVWVQDSGRIDETGVSSGVITCLEPYVTRTQHDALTGRLNRPSFERLLDERLKHGMASGTLLAFSIDNMTWLNEAIGPQSANEVILAVARRIEDTVPRQLSGMTLARIGGDAFALLLAGIENDAVDAIAQNIVQSFRDQSFMPRDGTSVNISVSAGAVRLPDQATTGIEAITRVEQALKTGRQNGRSTYRVYEPSEGRRTQHLSSLSEIDRVRAAIAAGDFVLAFQPIVSTLNGALSFYEGLLRLRLGDGSYISVPSIIQAVEAHGLAQDLDRHVFGLALDALHKNPDLILSINVSGATASDASFLPFIEQKLRGKETLARRLIVEITETAAINDLNQTSNFVTLVHSLGGRVALDDFGEGFTALQHLRHLAVDLIKIDGGLIRGINENAGHQVMVKAILSMAQHMGVETVAEFVETEREAAWLQRHGANYLQGFWFGRPDTRIGHVENPTAVSAARDLLQASGMLTLSV